MKREFHVRFCEKLGGKLPLLTRPFAPHSFNVRLKRGVE